SCLNVGGADLPAQEFGTQQHASVRRNILKVKSHRGSQDHALSAAQIDGSQRVRLDSLAASEPDFFAIPGPGDTLLGCELSGEYFAVAFRIDDVDVTSVVAKDRMIEEGNLIARRRKADVADVSRSFIENFSKGILEPELPVDSARDGQLRSIFVPVSV